MKKKEEEKQNDSKYWGKIGSVIIKIFFVIKRINECQEEDRCMLTKQQWNDDSTPKKK